MTNLLGPVEPWLGLVDAFGVGLVLLVWYAVRGAGDRTRAITTAAGGLLLVLAVGTGVARATGLATSIAAVGFEVEGGRRVFDILLALAGVGIGVAAVLWAHARAEAVPTADDEESVGEGGIVARPRGWAARPGVDVAAVVLALALPVTGVISILGSYNLGSRGNVTAMVAIYHLLAGAVVGGVLLGGIRPDEEADPRVVLGAFVLVAAGSAATVAWVVTFSNEFWTAFGTGLVAGLLIAAAPRLIARAIPVDRSVLAAGACAALALVVLRGVASGRVSHEQTARFRRAPIDIGNLVPTPVFPSLPSLPSLPSFPSFPEPSFPSFPAP